MPVAEFVGTFGWSYDGVGLLLQHGSMAIQIRCGDLSIRLTRLFHLDGLRLDATQQIFDASSDHIIAAIARRVRETAGTRKAILTGENEPQDVRLLRAPERNGFGLDALWNDDFHHTAHVALRGRREVYYGDHKGGPQEFISAAKWGFLFQGQHYAWQKQRRGKPALDIEPAHFVNFLDNHDQIANCGRGDRIHALTAPGLYRALTAFLLLTPSTPKLFKGQEYAASQPFLYFADNERERAARVLKGRWKDLRQFPSLASGAMKWPIPATELHSNNVASTQANATQTTPLTASIATS